MSYPKFAVGEDVLVLSLDYPDVNLAEVTVVAKYFTTAVDSITGEHLEKAWRYKVEPEPRPDIVGVWKESSLRKRPSDFTFNELMDSLKAPQADPITISRLNDGKKTIKVDLDDLK